MIGSKTFIKGRVCREGIVRERCVKVLLFFFFFFRLFFFSLLFWSGEELMVNSNA